MRFIKSLFRWCFVLLALAVVTVVIDFLLLKLLRFVEGSWMALVWYAALLVVPWFVHSFMLKKVLPNKKRFAVFIALVTTVLMQMFVYRYLLLDLLSYSL